MSARPGINPAAPEIAVAPLIACGAGEQTMIEVHLRHPGPRPALVVLTIVGLDQSWIGEPVAVGPMQAGEIVRVLLPVQPEPGAMGARYPFVVAAEATDPLALGPPLLAAAESTLAVDSRERVLVDVDPAQVTAVFGRRVQVRITNPSPDDRTVSLKPTTPKGIELRLRNHQVEVPAGRTVSVRGRLRVRRPRAFGTVQAHAYALAVRGQGAPVVVEGTVRARPVFRGSLVKSVAVVLVVAVWAALGIIAIPRIASFFESGTSTTDVASGADGQSGSGAPSDGAVPGGPDAGGGGGGADGGAGAEGGAGADGGAGGQGGADGASALRLRGTVTGPEPGEVAVVLVPTSLVEAAAVGAEPAPGTDESTAAGLRAAGSAFGKIPSWAVRSAGVRAPQSVSTETSDDGAFSLAGIQAPGLYLLTFARAGFQTQRFIVNADTLSAAEPMKVELKAGEGALSGSVVSAAGPVGAATVAITDGRVALQTSTVSDAATGTPGSWNVTGLSTPGTYLVQASSPGFGTASSLVTLDAGGTATTDLTLVTGVAAITGQVSGQDQLGRLGGLGGISVAVTGSSGDVTTTRSATTVTSGPVGRFNLPDLPTPGDYTLTVSGPGYQQQVRDVSLAAGAGAVDLNISLTRADGVISGTVLGDPATDGKPDEGGLIGAGLTLTGPNVTFKTMSTSDPAGSYRFTGVPPGTYVLAGSQFGRVSSTVTVELVAAGEVTADLRLLSNADTELPADGRITGRAVDARTSAPLTCDRVPPPAQECVLTAAIDIPVADPITGRIVAGAPVREAITTSTAAQNFEFTLPAPDDPINPGLVPGLYTVRLSAPGYEPATTDVRVAQGQLAVAEPTVMQPLGLISGILTYRTGTPAAPTCVVVVPAGADNPTSCVPNPDGVQCTADGGPGQRCSLVAADGSYSVVGLTHGSYLLSVLPTDPEYQRPPAFAIRLDLGSEFRYDPVINRYGRLAVTVLTPNEDTGELEVVSGATVTAQNAAGDIVATVLTGTLGIAQLTGLDGYYEIRATLDPNDPNAASAVKGNVQVGLNEDKQLTLVPTSPVGPFVGKVVVVVAGVETPVFDATVNISRAVYGYDGAVPSLGTATVHTDNNGCFAIVPVKALAGDPPLTSPDCPTPITITSAIDSVRDASNNEVALVARRIVVNIEGRDILTYDSPGTVPVQGDGPVKTLSKFIVGAKPVSIGDVALSSLSPLGTVDQPDFAQATVRVVSPPQPPNGITVSAATGTGRLQWFDPSIGAAGSVAPGRYELTADMNSPRSGWTQAIGHLLCEYATPCRLVSTANGTAPGAFQLRRLPRLTGTTTGGKITGAALPNDAVTDFSKISITSPNTGITFTGVPDPVGAPAGQVAGLVTAKDPSLDVTNFVQPGTYRFTVSLPGYAPRIIDVVCGSDYLAPTSTGTDGCDAFTVALQRLPAVVPSFVALSPPRPPPGNTDPDNFKLSTVRVAVANHPEITVTVADSGQLTWNDRTQPTAGLIVPDVTYDLTYSRPGFADLRQSFSCAAAVPNCQVPSVTLSMLPQLTGTVRLSPPPNGEVKLDSATASLVNPPPNSTVQVALVRIPGDNSRFSLQWWDPQFPFKGIVPAGTYQVRVHIPGYADADSIAIGCETPGQVCVTDVSMTAIPTFTGTLVLSPATEPVTAKPVDRSEVNVTVVQGPSNIQVRVDAQGTISWADPSQPDGLVMPIPGGYRLKFQRAGFADLEQSFSCAAGAPVCGFAQPVQLLMLPRAGGTVQVSPAPPPNAPPISLAGARVTLVSPPSDASGVQITLQAVQGSTSQFSLHWSDSNLPFAGIVRMHSYQVNVHIPGYADRTSGVFDCLTAGATCGPTIDMQSNPQFTGSLILDPPSDGIPKIDVTPPLGVGAVTLRYSAGGFSWQEVGQPAGIVTPGVYSVSVTLAGYGPIVGQSYDCESTANCPRLELRMTKPTNLTVIGKASTAGGDPLGAHYVLQTVAQPPNLLGDATASASANSVAFPGLTAGQQVRLTIQAAGFKTISVDQNSSQVTCGTTTGLRLTPGELTCTVTMQRIGRVQLQSRGVVANGFEALASTSVTAVQVATPPVGGAQFSALTNPGGTGLLIGTNDAEGLNSGDWRISATRTGYVTTEGVITIDPTSYAVTVKSGQPTTPAGPGLAVLATGELAVVLAPVPVAPQVQLRTAAGDGVPTATTITLSDGSCTVPGSAPAICAPGDQRAIVMNGADPSSAVVAPGVYQVGVRSGTGQFAQLSQPMLVSPADPNPGVAMTLAANWSTQSGQVLDNGGAAQSGAEVTLHAANDLINPALAVDGTPLQVAAGDDGRFTFDRVPDGVYVAVAETTGWAPVSSPSITISAAANPLPADVALTATARDTRTVVVALSSAARTADGRPVDFAGGQFSLKPVAGTQPSGTPENTPLTGLTATATPAGFTVTANQVPTGNWLLSVDALSGAGFLPFDGEPFAVPPADPGADPPPVEVAQTVDLAPVTVTVDWAAGCGGAPAGGSLPIQLTRSAAADPVSFNAAVRAGPDGSGSAVLTALLPPGDYQWAAQPGAPGWIDGAGSFTVAPGGAPVASTGTLLAPAVPVTVSLTVDGAQVNGRAVAATPPDGGAAVTGQTGTPLCVPPGDGWTFSINDPNPAAATPLLIPDQAGVTVHAQGPNSVQFTGFSLRPAVQLATVTGRPTDGEPRPVALALEKDGKQVWTGTATIPAGSTGGQGPALIAAGGNYTLTGTPPTGDPFGVGTLTGIDPALSHAPVLTLPYAAGTVTVTALAGGAPRAGATVTLTAADGSGPAPQTANASGVAVFRDLPVADYTVMAASTQAGVTVRGELTGQPIGPGPAAISVSMVQGP